MLLRCQLVSEKTDYDAQVGAFRKGFAQELPRARDQRGPRGPGGGRGWGDRVPGWHRRGHGRAPDHQKGQGRHGTAYAHDLDYGHVVARDV